MLVCFPGNFSTGFYFTTCFINSRLVLCASRNNFIRGFDEVKCYSCELYGHAHLHTARHAFLPSGGGVNAKALLHSLSINEKMIGCLLSAIPLVINLLVVYALIKLFQLYEQGEIFTMRHVKYIRNIGFALLAGQIVQPFYQFAMGILLTFHNPPHFRYASITLDQTNIGILLTSIVVILISWIMAEGCKLREEQQLTI